MLYELENIRVSYNGRTALDLDRLDIAEGRIHAVLGPNGAGKSTLFRLLSFLEAPQRGKLKFMDRRVNGSAANLQSLRRQVVLVHQHPIMFSSTVVRNVEYGLKIRKVPARERRARALDALGAVGMEEDAGRWAPHLSGGETQRVAIARALACDPKVLLLDEPTASVDFENQIAIEQLIRDIHKDLNISILFCSHDRLQAARLAGEMLFLFDGRKGRSVFENIFSVDVVDGPGSPCCRLGDRLRLDLPEPARGNHRIKIALDPEAIRLQQRPFAENQNSGSQENGTGRILQLTEDQNRIRVLVDAGVPLSVLVPTEDYRRLHLAVGDRVVLEIPAESIRLLG